MNCHNSPPSDWIKRWHALVPTRGTCLDLACGPGRHARWLAQQDFRVCAADIDTLALDSLQRSTPTVECIAVDLEAGTWPFAQRQFDAVVVTHYLWRDRWPQLLACLSPGGVLMYETFSVDHASIGRPSRPQFLLQHGELLALCAQLRVIAYEDGYLDHPPRFVQRIVAVSSFPVDVAAGEAPRRHPLDLSAGGTASADQ